MKRWGFWLGALGAVAVLVVLLCVFLISHSKIRCYTEEEDHYLYLASRTTYERARGHNLTRLPSDSKCKPVQIWAFIRHGARYPEPKLINRYRKLDQLRDEIIENHEKGRGKLCDSDLELLKQWVLIPPADEIPPALLNKNGEEELKNFGKRLKDTFPELLKAGSIPGASQKDYKFRGTDNQRTQASQTALMEGIFEGEGVTVVPEKVPNNDSLLYVNMNCPTYQASLKLNPWNESDAFTESGAEFNATVERITERLGFEEEIDRGTVLLLWEICRYETAWKRKGQWSTWCLVFDPEDMQALEFREDIGTYYYAGPGRPINKQIACPTVKDLVQRFRNVVKNGQEKSGEPKSVFYFGHTVMLAATMGAMGMTESEVPFVATNYQQMIDRKFRTSLVGPFGGNLILVLYRCNSENKSTHKVTIHATERPWSLPDCPDGVCDWDTFEQKYADTADHCNLDFCYQ